MPDCPCGGRYRWDEDFPGWVCRSCGRVVYEGEPEPKVRGPGGRRYTEGGRHPTDRYEGVPRREYYQGWYEQDKEEGLDNPESTP